MYKTLVKNGQVYAFGLGLLITALFLLSAMGGIGEFNLLTKEQQYEGTTNIFNIGLYASIALVIICAIAIVLFGVKQAVSDPKSAKKFLIGLAILAAIFIIGYAMTQDIGEGGPLFELAQKFNISEGKNKFIGGALTSALILIVLAILAPVVGEIRNLLK